MKIVAHRGYWNRPSEANTLSSLESALKAGFGIETDVRSFRGELYISHDPVTEEKNLLKLETVLELAQMTPHCPLFLNIKEDGLPNLILRHRKQIDKLNVVFFDMSVPQLFVFSKHFGRENLATRFSDLEPVPSAIELCDWVWVDGFTRNMSRIELRQLDIEHPRHFAFVSPELHKRPHADFWRDLGTLSFTKEHALCTDLPVEFGRRLAA